MSRSLDIFLKWPGTVLRVVRTDARQSREPTTGVSLTKPSKADPRNEDCNGAIVDQYTRPPASRASTDRGVAAGTSKRRYRLSESSSVGLACACGTSCVAQSKAHTRKLTSLGA